MQEFLQRTVSYELRSPKERFSNNFSVWTDKFRIPTKMSAGNSSVQFPWRVHCRKQSSSQESWLIRKFESRPSPSDLPCRRGWADDLVPPPSAGGAWIEVWRPAVGSWRRSCLLCCRNTWGTSRRCQRREGVSGASQYLPGTTAIYEQNGGNVLEIHSTHILHKFIRIRQILKKK